MLNRGEEAFIAEYAYLPEHVPGYLVPFADLEPCLTGAYLYYRGRNELSLIGYPLGEDFDAGELVSIFGRLIKKYNPAALKVIAPEVPVVNGYQVTRRESDRYSRLDLKQFKIRPKLENMLRRARQELEVVISPKYTLEHHRLLIQFLEIKNLPAEVVNFLHRIPDYLAFSPTAALIEARRCNQGELVAYNIAEFGAGEYSFYLFNITRGGSNYVPGASDLLMAGLIDLARQQQKKYLNMGLGVNPGVEKFKSKWGAKHFLQYYFVAARPGLFSWRNFFRVCSKSLILI
jgi:hypothetical protein